MGNQLNKTDGDELINSRRPRECENSGHVKYLSVSSDYWKRGTAILGVNGSGLQ